MSRTAIHTYLWNKTNLYSRWAAVTKNDQADGNLHCEVLSIENRNFNRMLMQWWNFKYCSLFLPNMVFSSTAYACVCLHNTHISFVHFGTRVTWMDLGTARKNSQSRKHTLEEQITLLRDALIFFFFFWNGTRFNFFLVAAPELGRSS